MDIILASNSPRRKELLKNAGVDFTVIPSSFVEPKNTNLSPEKYAEFLAYNKALTVFNEHGGVVIGADTIVVLDGEILGKPIDENDAFCMLKSLSNKTHLVVTGYSVITSEKVYSGYDVTKVTFKELSNEVIKDYIKTGSPLDKAGAYGIQDKILLVDSVEGDYDNVVGLPTYKILKILAEIK
ncbi:MAG: septum formation protein Maf [Clostridiales bacterium]|nr:septum formation protein Maf [Clostridiales bacterium]